MKQKTLKLNAMLACQVAAKRMTAVLSPRMQTKSENQIFLIVDNRNVAHATCEIEKIKKAEECTQAELSRLSMNQERLKNIFGYVHFLYKIKPIPAQIIEHNLEYGWSEFIEEQNRSYKGFTNLIWLLLGLIAGGFIIRTIIGLIWNV